MPQTNAERQAAYRARRQLTPRNERLFWKALHVAFCLGKLRGKHSELGVGVDAIPRVLEAAANLNDEWSDGSDPDDDVIGPLLRALAADMRRRAG
jgi:hypothetical protein